MRSVVIGQPHGTTADAVADWHTTALREIERASYESDVLGNEVVPEYETEAVFIAARIQPDRNVVRLSGYYAKGDCPAPLVYTRLASAPSPVKRQHKQSFDGAWWVLVVTTPLHFRQFGAKGDGSTDDFTALQDGVTFAIGRPICGSYSDNYSLSDEVTSAFPVHIFGGNSSSGPGASADSANGCKFTMAGGAGKACFHITSIYGSLFHDFEIRKLAASTGAGIRLEPGTVSSVVNFQIRNVYFAGVDTPIRVNCPGWGVVEGCVFIDWHTAGVYYDTVAGTEGSGGFIRNNNFSGIIGTEGPAIYSEVGYTIVQANEIVGGDFTVDFNYKNFNAGFTKIVDNSIENSRTWSIRLRSQDGSIAAHIDISRNEVGGVIATGGGLLIAEYTAAPAWISNVSICDNVFATTLGAGAYHVNIQGGRYVSIQRNLVRNDSGTPFGIVINGATTNAGYVAPLYVFDNQMVGTFAAKYSFQGVTPVIFRDPQGTTFANIPANLAPGSQVYITDGKPTNLATGDFTLTSGGAGTWASLVDGGYMATPRPLTGNLAAIGGISSNGLIARTGSGTAAARTITGTANQISVANGDGASGDPTISLPSTVVVTAAVTIAGGAHNAPLDMRFDSSAQAAIAVKTTNASVAGDLFDMYSSADSLVGKISFKASQTGVDYLSPSDKDWKTDARPFDGAEAEDIIDRTAVKRYRWINTDIVEVGVFAQDEYEVFPQAFRPPAKAGEPWMKDLTHYVPVLLSDNRRMHDVLRDQQAVLRDQQAQIEALRGQIASLKSS